MITSDAPVMDRPATDEFAGLYAAIHAVAEEVPTERFISGVDTIRRFATVQSMLILAVDLDECAFGSDEKTRQVAGRIFQGCLDGYVFAQELIDG